MHTIIETGAYLKAADDAGMDEEERGAVIDLIAADPQAGAIMPAAAARGKYGFASRAGANRAAIGSSLIFPERKAPYFC